MMPGCSAIIRETSQMTPRSSLRTDSMGVGVIWDGIPFETPVIPAKAGIQSVDSAFPKVCRVESRFRGNDCGSQRPCLANDTSTTDITAFLCHDEHSNFKKRTNNTGMSMKTKDRYGKLGGTAGMSMKTKALSPLRRECC